MDLFWSDLFQGYGSKFLPIDDRGTFQDMGSFLYSFCLGPLEKKKKKNKQTQEVEYQKGCTTTSIENKLYSSILAFSQAKKKGKV